MEIETGLQKVILAEMRDFKLIFAICLEREVLDSQFENVPRESFVGKKKKKNLRRPHVILYTGIFDLIALCS